MTLRIDEEMARQLLPARPRDGHKGTFGHVFVLAGSRRYPGAMRLTCEAACRSGVGLVTAGIPRSLADVAAVTLLESMGLPLPDTEDGALGPDAVEPALDFARDKDGVVLGPGLSQSPEVESFVHALLPRLAAPLVIDADGLNLLARDVSVLDTRAQHATILTPHPGEMARLAGVSTKEVQADRDAVAQSFAQEHGVVVVLKGFETVIAEPEGALAVNTSGNHGMGTGGTGDVLAGLLGGLLAQGMRAWDAARLGVWLHGRAGDVAAERFTKRAMIARDVIAAIPEAFRSVERL